MKRIFKAALVTSALVVGFALLVGACKNGKGCKVEDQCGRLLEVGTDRTCTEIRCVPNACKKPHETMLGHELCDRDGAMPAASSKK